MNGQKMYDHTLGPWEVLSCETLSIISPALGRVAIITHLKGLHGMGGRRSIAESEGNALLIAAAPNLLCERDELRAKLERIASIAGNPDPAEACRLIIKECEL